MCSDGPGQWPDGPRNTGETVEIDCADGTSIPVHLCRPDGDPPYPTVLIIHDYFDPEHFYHELACRYAGAGYLGVVPSLFHRHGKLDEQAHEKAGQRVAGVADQEVLDDVNVVLDHLKGQGLLGDLVITGFCWGGRMSYLVAARHREARLLLPFYGHLSAWSGPDGPKPHSPLDEAAKIDCRVLGFYGGADQSIPLDQVREMEDRLRQKGVPAELRVYDGAPHSFFRDPEFKKDSDDAWRRVLDALGQTLDKSPATL